MRWLVAVVLSLYCCCIVCRSEYCDWWEDRWVYVPGLIAYVPFGNSYSNATAEVKVKVKADRGLVVWVMGCSEPDPYDTSVSFYTNLDPPSVLHLPQEQAFGLNMDEYWSSWTYYSPCEVPDGELLITMACWSMYDDVPCSNTFSYTIQVYAWTPFIGRIESVDQMLYTYTVPLIAIEMDPEVVAYTFEISSSLILPTLQTGTWDAVVILSPPSEHDWWTITLAPYNSSYYCGEPPCGTWGETTIVEDSYVSTTFTNVVPGNNYSLVLSLPTLEYSYTNIVRYPSMLIQLTARHLEDGYAEVPETTFGLTLISEVLALTVVLAGVGGLAGYLVYKHKQHRLMYNLLINPSETS
ncbi:hypothetical protein Pelo_3854 [Pelomyxa schiedti]|nr:hypothetical protein Pelo_3854 [Pelomyxa schiedti]